MQRHPRQRVLVKQDAKARLSTWCPVRRQSCNRTPQCNPSITIGDELRYFGAIRNPSQHNFSEGGADKQAQ
jgi:hypothetical protein